MSNKEATNLKYWKGLEEYEKNPEFEKQKHNEFAEELPVEKIFGEDELNLSSNRRDFLKFFGFGISAATLAACTRTPVRKAIPFVIAPEEIKPGKALYYATTMAAGNENYSVLVKTREGRPIKIEGNPESPLGQGGTCALGQASVLSLYDKGRLQGPLKNKSAVSWEDVDEDIRRELRIIERTGGQIRLLTDSINSPSALKAINKFKETFPNTKHISYDAVSAYGILAANQADFGKSALPDFHFDKADMIVSFGADFLGTWISPVQFTKQYSKHRKVRDDKELKMNYHVQFESSLSLTGSNADLRATIKPSQEAMAVASLYSKLRKKAGHSAVSGADFDVAGNAIEHTANELWKNRTKSLVVSASNDVRVQKMINEINKMLENYGKTLDIDNPSYQKRGNDKQFGELVNEMNEGKVEALIMIGVNPAYSYAEPEKFKSGLEKVNLKVSVSERLDETAMLANYVCPDHHYLESWSDHQPKKGLMLLSQPTISPIFNTRAFPESLMAWTGENINYHDYIKAYWEENIFPAQNEEVNFERFWANCIHDGFYKSEHTINEEETDTSEEDSLVEIDASDAARQIASQYRESNDIEIALYEKVGIRDGKDANNPWLQELPDPVTKACWDNYAAVSPKFAKDNNLKEEDLITIKSANHEVKLPVLLQPGQTYNTIGIAVGYGHKMDKEAAKVANDLGANAYPFSENRDGAIHYGGAVVTIEKAAGKYQIAKTQTHHHMEGRDIIRETTLQDIEKDPKAGTKPAYPSHTLYREWKFKSHHWGMAIDLSACTGCGSCVISCQAENNVPVVGKEEVLRRREMHWIRVDRYYSGDPENPEVLFQPMMCQQCDQAPCTNVCPVAAIAISSEGLNQQVYNRCVGTRYCANNCPYKVRRFNWFNYANTDNFDYNMNNPLGRMVLNPDVAVRSRGVMEKCSFCVQKIQEGKLKAKMENRPVKDGDIKTACQKACPADAIAFGDMNDETSEVRKMMDDKRAYEVLEVIEVESSVRYMPKVRNKKHKA